MLSVVYGCSLGVGKRGFPCDHCTAIQTYSLGDFTGGGEERIPM